MQFVTLEHSVRPLIRALADNQIVGIVLTAELGKSGFPCHSLNRSFTEQWSYRLANRCEATILPTFVG